MMFLEGRDMEIHGVREVLVRLAMKCAKMLAGAAFSSFQA